MRTLSYRWRIFINTVSRAIETRDINHAGAWKTYDEESADAEQLYQEKIAEAKRDHAVAIAQAQRNLTVTGDQSAYDAAIQSANADLEADELAAARDYAISEIGARGGRDVTLHGENTTLDTTEGVAHVARVDNIMGHGLRREFCRFGPGCRFPRSAQLFNRNPLSLNTFGFSNGLWRN